MTNFKFEGEIQGVSERQLEFVSSVLAKRGFSNEKVLFSAVGKIDDNFAANVKRIVVEKNGVTFKMVAKIASTNEIVRAKMPMKLVFANEHAMYTSVLPKFTELEKGADIPESERFRYAECYGSLSEEPNEIILLEDLQVSNFSILDRYKSLTDETIRLVLKNFARLHSLSYALKKQEPETYEGFKNKLGDMTEAMQEMGDFQGYYNQIESDIISVLDNDKYKRTVKGILVKAPQNMTKNFKMHRNSKYAIIQQGDPWTNNMLFKLEDNKTVECCMVDYQMSGNNSPVADLEYMIFNCTDYETRSKHYHEWIDYYHAQLDKCLANFGLKANFVYPRDQLDADLRRYGKIGLGFSMMLAHMLLRESDEAANIREAIQSESNLDELINAAKISNVNKTSVLRIKTRIEGLIASFLELGYL